MGQKRFGELKKSCSGISQKVLTHNLRQMEDNGLVKREVFPQIPPRVDILLQCRYQPSTGFKCYGKLGNCYKTFLKLLAKRG